MPADSSADSQGQRTLDTLVDEIGLQQLPLLGTSTAMGPRPSIVVTAAATYNINAGCSQPIANDYVLHPVSRIIHREPLAEWIPHEHPEGALYFRHIDQNVFTDVDLYDPAALVSLTFCKEQILRRPQADWMFRSGDVDLVLDILTYDKAHLKSRVLGRRLLYEELAGLEGNAGHNTATHISLSDEVALEVEYCCDILAADIESEEPTEENAPVIIVKPWGAVIALIRFYNFNGENSARLDSTNSVYGPDFAEASGSMVLEPTTRMLSYISVFFGLGSIMTGMFLARQYRQEDRDAGFSEIANRFFARRSIIGFQSLAMLYSLPYAFMIWGMFTFVLAFLTMTIQSISGASRCFVVAVFAVIFVSAVGHLIAENVARSWPLVPTPTNAPRVVTYQKITSGTFTLYTNPLRRVEWRDLSGASCPNASAKGFKGMATLAPSISDVWSAFTQP
ncbi:hypothetical protein C8R44DRAFT_949315 [Mycena epipterygia]|nr:hypothetical protein C8R44DRAFT_949315 [Mycena epipterygia]